MRPLIIGGGVAGCVAGCVAHRAGFAPRVFEAYPRSTGLAHGAYLTVAVNGLDALRAVGAAQVVTEGGFPSREISFFSGTGRALGSVAMGPVLPDGTVTHTIRRDVLYRGLAEEVTRRGIPIEHGKRLVAVDGTRVRFADGTTADGDEPLAVTSYGSTSAGCAGSSMRTTTSAINSGITSLA